MIAAMASRLPTGGRMRLWGLTAILAAWPAPLMAAPTPQADADLHSVEVVPPSCKAKDFPMGPFLDALRVELTGQGLVCCTLADPDTPSVVGQVLRVRLDLAPCSPHAATMIVDVADQQISRTVEREVSLADMAPTARPRALALAVAELIRPLRQPPLPSPSSTVAQTLPVPSAPLTASVIPSRKSLHVEGQVRTLPTRNTILWGGRMRLTLPWHALYVGLDLGADRALGDSDLGKVILESVSVGLGMGPRLTNRSVVLDLGPRLEIGQAWIHGETRAPDVITGSGGNMILLLGLRASLELPAGSRLRPGVALEAGGVLRGTRGESDGRTVVGITGYHFSGSLACAFSL